MKQKKQTKVLALPPSDDTLIEAKVMRTWSMVPKMIRKIE